MFSVMKQIITVWTLILALIAPPAYASALPKTLIDKLKKYRIPTSNIAVLVHRTDDTASIIAHQPTALFNPASVVKVVNTVAALDLLGVNHQWKTTFLTTGKVSANGALEGDLYIRGGADPYITTDRFLYMVLALRAAGIRQINGDVIIDSSMFALAEHDQGAFDGASLKPYNVGAGAMMVNFKTHQINLDYNNDTLRTYSDPPSDAFVIDNKLKATNRSCRNWRGRFLEQLRETDDYYTFRLKGEYAKRCGHRSFYIASLDTHEDYVFGVFSKLWKQIGGTLSGGGKSGATPEEAQVIREFTSQSFLQVLHGMNKFSNNAIARNVFLSLPMKQAPPPYSLEQARQTLAAWSQQFSLPAEQLFVDNGSGLSRGTRISAHYLYLLFRYIWEHPLRAEILSTLPIVAVDGTMRKRLRNHEIKGHGRFKTGSLEGVRAIAGVMRNRQGDDVIVICLINTRRAYNGTRFQDDLLRWVYQHAI